MKPIKFIFRCEHVEVSENQRINLLAPPGRMIVPDLVEVEAEVHPAFFDNVEVARCISDKAFRGAGRDVLSDVKLSEIIQYVKDMGYVVEQHKEPTPEENLQKRMREDLKQYYGLDSRSAEPPYRHLCPVYLRKLKKKYGMTEEEMAYETGLEEYRTR